MRYKFDVFEFDADRFELLDANGTQIELQTRSLELLALLLRHPGALIDKKSTQEEIWGGLHTSPGAMRMQVRKLRAALGDTEEPHRLIETMRGKGLRFVGEVSVEGGGGNEADSPPAQSASTKLKPSPASFWSARSFALLAGGLIFISAVVALGLGLGLTSRETIAQSAGARPYEASVAVLPFIEVGDQTGQTHIGAGLSDELSSVLARIEGFKVSSSSSTFRLAEVSGQTVSQTAKTLGVTHVVEGSFARVGPTLKLTVHLIDAATDDRIWTETYTRPYNTANIVRMQEQIVSAVVVELVGELVPPSQLPIVKTQSSESLDLPYRAQELLRAQTKNSTTQAIEYLKRAIEIDPNFVDPYSLLALAYEDAYFVAGLPWDEVDAKRREAVAKGVELAPNDNDVLIARAIIMTDDGDVRAAISMFQKALAADPNNSYALGAMGIAYAQIGRAEEALEVFRRARDIDPLSPSVLQTLALEEYSSGDTQTALEVARTNLRGNGVNPAVIDNLAWLLRLTGNYIEANELLMSIMRESPENDTYAEQAGELYLQIGWDEMALAVVSSSKHAKSQVDAKLGNRAQVERYLAEYPDPDALGNEAGELYFYLREFEAALPYTKRTIEDLEVTGSADAAINELVWLVGHAHVLCEMGDPDCKVLLEKLEERLFDVTPQNADTYHTYIAGAGVQMLRGDEGEALKWLQAAFEDGQLFVDLVRHPTFEPLADNPAFESLETQMEAKARALRTQFRNKVQ